MAWRVARSLDVLLAQLNTRYPNRSKTSDGSIGDAAHSSRVSDHNPDAGGVVRARDYTHDPAHGVDIDRLSDEIAASRDPRVKYCIANNLIMSGAAGPRPWQWTPYQGSNPHRNHMHLSVVADSRADDPRPWALPMLMEDRVELTGNQARQLDEVHHELTLRLGNRSPHAPAGAAGDTVLGWAASSYARSDQALHELRALAAALPALIQAEVRTALAGGLVDVDITVQDKTARSPQS